ncbi:MAG: PAS domain S-box protein, partial [Planctomycetaceae bacterium]
MMDHSNSRDRSEALPERLEQFAEALPQAVVVTDRLGTIALVNSVCERLFGHSREELIGRPVEMLFPARLRGGGESVFTPAFLWEDVADEDLVGLHKTGREFPIEVQTGRRTLPTRHGNWIVHTITDAGDRRRAEQSLRNTEALYQSLVETLPLNIFRKNTAGEFVFANHRFCENLKLSPVELIGKTDHDFYPAELADKYRRDDEAVIRAGRMFEDVEQHTDPNGLKTYVHVLKAPVRDGSGEIVGIQGMYWDVSARHRAEEARRDGERRTRMILDSACDSFIGMDEQGRITDWNRQAEDTFGWARDEVLGQPVAETIIPERYRKSHWTGLRRFLETGRSDIVGSRIELSARHRDGREFPIELSITAVRINGGLSFSAFVRDITEKKQAEDAIRRRDAQFRNLVESNIIGIMICGLNGAITQANDAFLATTGYTREDLEAGRVNWRQLTPPDWAHLDDAAIRSLKRTGTCPPWEKEYVRKDGSRVPVVVGVTVLEDPRDKVLCFVLDITVQKEAERQLQAAKEAADEAN